MRSQGWRSSEEWSKIREAVSKAVEPFNFGVLVEERIPSSRYPAAARELLFQRGSVYVRAFKVPLSTSIHPATGGYESTHPQPNTNTKSMEAA